MAGGKRDAWNARYAASELVWGVDPNYFLAEAFSGVEPRGRALDLACGEGRNAIWLAERGWNVTGVDFSGVAIERGRGLAARRDVSVELIEGDVTEFKPEHEAYALLLVLYLQIPPVERRGVWALALDALAPGAELFLVGHARRNLEAGVGGPLDPEVLWDPDELRSELESLGVRVLESVCVTRPVAGADRDAIDTRVRAVRDA